jgi:hypothetical protein
MKRYKKIILTDIATAESAEFRGTNSSDLVLYISVHGGDIIMETLTTRGERKKRPKSNSQQIRVEQINRFYKINHKGASIILLGERHASSEDREYKDSSLTDTKALISQYASTRSVHLYIEYYPEDSYVPYELVDMRAVARAQIGGIIQHNMDERPLTDIRSAYDVLRKLRHLDREMKEAVTAVSADRYEELLNQWYEYVPRLSLRSLFTNLSIVAKSWMDYFIYSFRSWPPADVLKCLFIHYLREFNLYEKLVRIQGRSTYAQKTEKEFIDAYVSVIINNIVQHVPHIDTTCQNFGDWYDQEYARVDIERVRRQVGKDPPQFYREHYELMDQLQCYYVILFKVSARLMDTYIIYKLITKQHPYAIVYTGSRHTVHIYSILTGLFNFNTEYNIVAPKRTDRFLVVPESAWA